MTLPRAVVRTTGVSTAGGGGVGGCSVGGCALACASTHCCSLSARSCNGDVSAGTSTDGATSGRFSVSPVDVVGFFDTRDRHG